MDNVFNGNYLDGDELLELGRLCILTPEIVGGELLGLMDGNAHLMRWLQLKSKPILIKSLSTKIDVLKKCLTVFTSP